MLYKRVEPSIYKFVTKLRRFPLALPQTSAKHHAMKLSTPNSIILAASILVAASSISLSQTTATTDPVGFVTMNVAAGTGTNAALSFNALGLTQTVEYQGSAETAGGTSLIDNEAPSGYGIVVSASAPYFVEISSGAAAGTTYDILSVVGMQINLVQSLAGSVAAGDTFKIRKHWTLGTIFGPTNSAGLTGGTLTTADSISIYTGAGYNIYYYKTSGLGGTGWRSTASTSVDEQHRPIYPDDGFVISRKAATVVPVVLAGAVKTGQSSYPISTGLNIVTNPYAAPMTLATSGIYTGNSSTGLLGGTLTTADQLLLWNGIGYNTYYYKTSGLGGTGWRSTASTSVDESAASIPVGSAVLVVRKNAAFNWVIPQHPTTL